MILRPVIKLAPAVKPLINVGALLDIPTGNFVFGRYGEAILNAGLGAMTGVVGIGNNFKSTILRYMSNVAMARMGVYSSKMTYDTETNTHEWHLRKQLENILEYMGEDPILSQRWQLTDKTVYTGDQWYDLLREFMSDKVKNAKKYSIKTPFVERDGITNMTIIIPTFADVDSLSEFTTKDVIKMQDDNSLGDSGANMVFMRQGVQKNRFLMEAPSDAAASYTYLSVTAHIGTEFVLDPHKPPPKKLQHLKGGVKLKGVPEKFTFVMNNCWHCYNAAPLINKDLKAPEFPSEKGSVKGDTDLNSVMLMQLRSKAGISGIAQEILVSQTEGVKAALTEFYFLKDRAGRFGLGGNVQNYNLVYCPDVNLSRTTVRTKLDNDLRLARAANLLAEHAQVLTFWTDIDPMWAVKPELIYEELKRQGYDWNQILDTRGWWAPCGQHFDTLFLSTMDLLRMYHGTYIPYWMDTPPEGALKKYKEVTGQDWKQPKEWIEDRKEFQKIFNESEKVREALIRGDYATGEE